MGKVKGGGASGRLARKELRKAHKQAAKEKRQQRHNLKQQRQTTPTSEESTSAAVAPADALERKPRKGGNPKRKDAVSQPAGGIGTTAAGARRKRWRPEELDPMIAVEDAELKRLERLLGVSGPNAKKKRAKLEREIAVEDGMGDDFGTFLSDLDRIGDFVDRGGGSGSSDDERANWDFHEDVPADDDIDNNDMEGPDGAAAQDGVEDEENEEEGGGGRELLDGVVDSDDELLESIQGEGTEDDEEGEVQAGGGAGGDLSKVVADHVGSSSKTVRDQKDKPDEGDEDGDDDDDVEQEVGVEEEDQERKLRSQDTAGYGDEDDGDSSQGLPAAEEESEDFKWHTYQPKPGQDIYGRTIGAANDGTAPAAYVPPHLRAAAAAQEGGGANGTVAADKLGGSVKHAKVQRVINGITNRLSEETLEPVTARLREAYRGHSTTEANEALWQATRAVCVHDKHVMTTLIPAFAAVIAALNISLGADVGGFFLEIITRQLEAEVWGAAVEGGVESGNAGGSDSARHRNKGTGSNLLLLLAYLYNYGVAHCTLVYDIVGLLVEAFGAYEMELLLLLLRHSGYKLRSDDPQALKQIVALVKEKSSAAAATAGADLDANGDTGVSPEVDGSRKSSIAEETGRWKAAFGARARSSQAGGHDNGDGPTAVGTNSPVGGTRARYILDTILELQGNKRSRIQEQGQELGRRVRKWLGSVKAAKGGGGGDTSLRVTWAELVSTENKGRWWRVGAAWAGRGASAPLSAAAAPEDASSATVDRRSGSAVSAVVGGGSDAHDSEAVGLLALAARQRMNTDVRRSVFVAIVGSTDCEDALEKILRLSLKGAQEREIARVIMECCSQEASYNPFYAHLAERVCDRQPKLRFTFQVAFWDALKTLEDTAARRAGSMARLMAHLVIRKQLSLTVLKTVEVGDLSPSGILLMRVFFHEIIAAGDDAAFMEVFRRLARPAGAKEGGGHSAARDNALVFLRGHLGPAPSDWERNRRKTFRKRVKGACRLIEAIVTADELG